MPNALILVSEGAGAKISGVLGACRSIAPQTLIVSMCENAVRLMPQAELDALTSAPANVILSPFEPHGEACCALLAAEWIDNDSELVVANPGAAGIDLAAMSAHFRNNKLAAGVATRDLQKPGVANVRLDAEGLVIEASGGKRIGDIAAAGVFWFAHGGDFLRAVQNMIRKNPNQSEPFDICPALNELVLENRPIGTYPVLAAA
jgi:hypothetical protein